VKRHFRLNAYCYLVDGLSKGCIYNVSTGDMISIDEDKLNLLNKCESNIPLDRITDTELGFLDTLVGMSVGIYYETPMYVERFYVGQHPAVEMVAPSNYAVGNAFIELDTMCNFDCVFCKEGDNTLFRKTGCKRWARNEGSTIRDIDQWKDILGQLAKLNCQQVTFVGGEPFLQFSLMEKLLAHAKAQGIYRVLIYTNGSLLNDEILECIKKYNAELNVQVLGSNDDTYRKITGVSEMHSKVLDNVSLLASDNVRYTLTFLVNRLNENEIEDAYALYSPFTNPNRIRLEFLYPLPHNDFYSTKFLGLMYDKTSSFGKVDVNSFCHHAKYHNCYGHQLGITAEGDILPCIMSRKLVLGNVRKNDIVSILKDSDYEQYQKLTKDEIDKCKQCSYRYGCFDCRALEMSATDYLKGLEYCNLKSALRSDEVLEDLVSI